MSGRVYILSALWCLVLTCQVAALEPGKKYNFRFKDGQHLRNAILLEETRLNYRVRLEYIQEEKILEKKDLKEIPVLAHSLSALPVPGSTLAGLKKIVITFAEPVTGAENPENYKLTGPAAGTLKIAGVKSLGKYQYELSPVGQAADGDLTLRLAGITDNVGAPLMSDTIEYKLDVTRPKVDASPATGSALRLLSEISLQYSEQVRGAEKTGNYEVAGPGRGSLKLKSVTQSVDNRYLLKFTGKPGNGEIKLTLKKISDLVGNPPESLEISYAGDTILPSFTSLPVQDSLLREFKTVEFIFSENVSGADKAENYRLEGGGTGDLRVSNVVRTEGNRYRLDFVGTPATGIIVLSLNNVTDPAGNPLRKNSVKYTTDLVQPRFTYSPGADTPVNRLDAVQIAFSKPVSGATEVANYSLEGDAVKNLAITSIRKLKGESYVVHFSGSPGDGKVTLRLKNISDAAGNVLQADSADFSVDATPPQCTVSPAAGARINALREIALQCSEAVVGADLLQSYVLSGEGAGKLTISAVKGDDQNRYLLSVSGKPGNGGISLGLNGITDRAGNAIQEKKFTFLADTISPQLTKVTPGENSPLNDLTGLELQYSETVSGAENPRSYEITGDGRGTLAVASVTPLSGDRVRLGFSGKPGNGKFALRVQNVADLAQNPLETKDLEFSSDTISPGLTANIPAGKSIASLESLTLSYSERVSGAADVKNYRLSGEGRGTLQVKKVREEESGAYVLEFSGRPANGEITLRVDNVADRAGNPLAGEGISFIADTTAPRMDSDPQESQRLNSLTEIQLGFSEPVLGADLPQTYRLHGQGAGSLQITGIEPLAQNQVKIRFSGKPGNGQVELRLEGVTDLAGNSLSTNRLTYESDTTAPVYSVSPASGAVAKEFSGIEVTYSEPVAGANDAGRYALSGEGVGSLRVDRVEKLSDNKYRVMLNGTPQSGDIRFSINNIADLAGNALAEKSIVYHSDTVKPTLIATPQPGTALHQFSKVTLRFSKPVNGALDKSSYALRGDGVGSLRLEKITQATESEFELVFSGTAKRGGVFIDIRGIADKAGNTPDLGGLDYLLDPEPIAMVARPAVGSTLPQLKEVELQFSKPVLGAEDPKNYQLTVEDTQVLKISRIENRGKNRYILYLSGDLAGPVEIQIRNISDAAGNILKNNQLKYVIEIPTASQPCGDIIR